MPRECAQSKKYRIRVMKGQHIRLQVFGAQLEFKHIVQYAKENLMPSMKIHWKTHAHKIGENTKHTPWQ
jgi:hypothetical protein